MTSSALKSPHQKGSPMVSPIVTSRKKKRTPIALQSDDGNSGTSDSEKETQANGNDEGKFLIMC